MKRIFDKKKLVKNINIYKKRKNSIINLQKEIKKKKKKKN